MISVLRLKGLAALAALTAAVSVAVPAQGLDFGGLRPGMPASLLAQLGEPEFRTEGTGTIIEALYPMPFGQHLRVMHDGDRILFLEASSDDNPDLPATQGLQAWRMTLSDTVARAGSEGWFFDQDGQVIAGIASLSYRLTYDLEETDDYVLSLVFFDADGTADRDDEGLYVLPPDIPLLSAELIHQDLIDAFPEMFGTTRIERPGAAPFALPLSEAFPLTPISQ